MFGGSKKPTTSTPVASRPVYAPSIVSGNLKITGDMESDGDIQIDGQVDGDIRTGKLTIGPEAVVNGCIRADEVMVSGTVNGAVEAGLVKLYATARVTGDISHESLAIEAGAFIQGLCKRVDLTPKTKEGEDAKREVADVKLLSGEEAPTTQIEGSDEADEKTIAPPTLVKG